MAEFMEYDWKATRISRDLLNQDVPYKKSSTLDKTTALQSLRNLIQQSRDLEFKSNIKQDDTTLLKFLYAKKFNVEDTCQLLQNYYWHRKKNSEIFKNFTLDADIKLALQNGLPTVLSSKDRKGRCVLVLTASDWNRSYSLISIYRSLLFCLEFLITEVHNQANGFVVIVDWTEFTAGQSWDLIKFGSLKLMIEGLRDCFPARFKGIHFIGQSWYVSAGVRLIKSFVNDKMKERIHVHGNNLSTLHDYVTKDILPAELGGEQPSHNPEIWLKKLVNSESQK